MEEYDDLESRFTPANDFCSHPEWWTSPDCDSTEYEVSEMIAGLIRGLQPEFVLETGTAYGYTTYMIGEALLDNGHGKLVSIDADAGMIKEAQKRIHRRLPVELININSMEYVPEKPIDFAFFDSWQEGRELEFRRYHGMGFLPKGATVVFHDTAPHHVVWSGVERLETEGLIKLLWLHTPRGVAIGQVVG